MKLQLLTALTMSCMCSVALASEDATEDKGAEAVAETQATAETTNEGKSEASKATLELGTLAWHTDYVEAYREARAEKKQLLLFFYDPKQPNVKGSYETTVLAHRDLAKPLGTMVRVVLPIDYTLPDFSKPADKTGDQPSEAEGTKTDGTTVTVRKVAAPQPVPEPLLHHRSFGHMQRKCGIAVIDLVDEKDAFHGQVVSAHPFTDGQHYSLPNTRIVLGLPRATITQRTLVYAVRTHPEAPQSTQGQANPVLLDQAAHHSALMAQYGSVGHHDWGTRSSQVASQLGVSPVEVAATSWSANGIIDAANQVVAQWRGSSAHWWMVYAAQGKYGYDMVKTPSGAWYATGIFTGQ